ncbi:MAG TPA: hypothetical protein DCY25_05415 [Bacteroidales bacterium]|nr:hypothetical protein [Bacteroidales bacterium]
MTARHYTAALFLAALSAFLLSCSPEACFEETNAYLKATFYSNDTKEKKTPDSLSVKGIGIAEKIYDRKEGVQPGLFPLDASGVTCSFEIKINDVTDTVSFHYTSYPHLISKECGYTFYHRLDTFFCKNESFYIYLSSDNITTANEENIRIFY